MRPSLAVMLEHRGWLAESIYRPLEDLTADQKVSLLDAMVDVNKAIIQLGGQKYITTNETLRDLRELENAKMSAEREISRYLE